MLARGDKVVYELGIANVATMLALCWGHDTAAAMEFAITVVEQFRVEPWTVGAAVRAAGCTAAPVADVPPPPRRGGRRRRRRGPVPATWDGLADAILIGVDGFAFWSIVEM